MQFFELKQVEEAQRIILTAAPAGPLGAEQVPLAAALGRVLAAPVAAPEALPAFPRSTVDGYAVRAADTFGASESLPAYLTVTGDIPMGVAAIEPLGPGETAKIATGGMLPPGADAVVMFEHTEMLAEDEVGVLRPAAPGDNVMRRGEDAAAGQVLVPGGRPLRPQELGALALAGITAVTVARRPTCAVISTGDELVDPGETPPLGKVRDTNTITMMACIEREGGIPVFAGRTGDAAGDIAAALRRGLACDMVLISGGSSVGTRDLTAELIQSLGEPGILVHGVKLKPGKPTILAMVADRPVLGLPGHPVSAQVVFELFAAPLLRRLQGLDPFAPWRPATRARISKNVASAPGRTDGLRVSLRPAGGEWWAEPVHGKSGLLTTLVKADGLVIIPSAREGLVAGEWVEVQVI